MVENSDHGVLAFEVLSLAETAEAAQAKSEWLSAGSVLGIVSGDQRQHKVQKPYPVDHDTAAAMLSTPVLSPHETHLVLGVLLT